MRRSFISGTDSLSPPMRIAICAALMAVSGMLAGDELHLQLAGAHVVARVSEIEHVSRGRRGGTNVHTHLRFDAPDGTPTSCRVGDLHTEVGRMVPIRYLPPASCAAAGDFSGIAIWGSFGLLGVAGLVWTLARRPKR